MKQKKGMKRMIGCSGTMQWQTMLLLSPYQRGMKRRGRERVQVPMRKRRHGDDQQPQGKKDNYQYQSYSSAGVAVEL